MIATELIVEQVKVHAAKETPRECCGVVIKVNDSIEYVPCRNVAAEEDQFAIDKEDWAKAEDTGEIVMICHSHPFVNPKPSPADLDMCELTGLPWLIVNHPVGTHVEFSPSGHRTPLLGRQFVHGIHDCYSLIRDYYAWELNLILPDFERESKWWEKDTYPDLYRKHFAEAGFVEVALSDLRLHDVIFMCVGSKGPNHPNHGAVFLGDDNKIIHHMMDRVSTRTVFGGWYRERTVGVVRHKELV